MEKKFGGFVELIPLLAVAVIVLVLGTSVLVGEMFFGTIKAHKTISKAESAAKNTGLVIGGLQRFENVRMPEEFMTVSVPTTSYLARLDKTCTDFSDEHLRAECSWYLEEIRLGADEVRSLINPLYGRPPFTDGQFKGVIWRVERVGRLVEKLEHLGVTPRSS